MHKCLLLRKHSVDSSSSPRPCALWQVTVQSPQRGRAGRKAGVQHRAGTSACSGSRLTALLGWFFKSLNTQKAKPVPRTQVQ